jgi:hypothetical protein
MAYHRRREEADDHRKYEYIQRQSFCGSVALWRSDSRAIDQLCDVHDSVSIYRMTTRFTA